MWDLRRIRPRSLDYFYLVSATINKGNNEKNFVYNVLFNSVMSRWQVGFQNQRWWVYPSLQLLIVLSFEKFYKELFTVWTSRKLPWLFPFSIVKTFFQSISPIHMSTRFELFLFSVFTKVRQLLFLQLQFVTPWHVDSLLWFWNFTIALYYFCFILTDTFNKMLLHCYLAMAELRDETLNKKPGYKTLLRYF